MNSATEARARRAWAAVFAAAALGTLAAGCGDFGPTNLYSGPLFGQKQAGGGMQVANVSENSLSSTAGAGPDQYVIWIGNAGPGGVMGPITANVTLASSFGAYLTSGTGGVTLTSQTVDFGGVQTVIYPGDTLAGTAAGAGAAASYSLEVAFPAACSMTADTFNIVMTDAQGDVWRSSFQGKNE